jgi:serine/threonine protein kinase
MENSLTGQDIDGYHIGPLLGVGGMGEVYQAFRTTDNEAVAIKFLRADYSGEPNFQSRFIREIRIMEALQHENIVPIYDHGIINGTQLYYAMRLITGASFSTLLRRRKFSPATYWLILEQVAAALDFGHTQNVVHRDLKPDNIFIENAPGGGIKVFVGDFGLGKREGQDRTLTEAGAAIGTPHYMSPEAIMGERPARTADIYSIAVLSYEVLVGKLPFDDEHAHTVAIAHVTRPAPKPTSLVPDFPPAMERVILKSLEKSPAARHQTMAEFAADYKAALDTLSSDEKNAVYALD